MKQSEEKYRSLFENLNSAALLIESIFNGDGRLVDLRYLMANSSVKKHLGKTQDELVGKLYSEVFPYPKRNPVFDIYEEVLSSGESFNGEVFLPAINKHFDMSVYRPIEGRLALVMSDISDRKKAEEALRQSEDQFRTLVNNLKSGVALIDENGRFAVVNPSFMQIFGLDNELDIQNVNSQDWSLWEVYGEDGKLLHVDDHPVRKVAMTCKPVKDQLVALRNPGANELIWLLVSAEPILKEYGQIYRIICTYYDITELKQAEEALRESEEQYRMLFENSLDGIILTDPRGSGKIMSANPAACKMLGWTEEELIGKGREVMFDVEDLALHEMLNKRATAMSARTQLTYKRKDGTTFPGEISSAVFEDTIGNTKDSHYHPRHYRAQANGRAVGCIPQPDPEHNRQHAGHHLCLRSGGAFCAGNIGRRRAQLHTGSNDRKETSRVHAQKGR